MPNKGEKYQNFLDLIIKEKVSRSKFQEYQIQRMKWLFDNDLIRENDSDYKEFTDIKKVYALKELYFKDVLSYWHYPDDIKNTIDDLANQGYVSFESILFSRNEQDYFDFYLNKAKFTNGLDL
ncbi:hypothetical protein YSY43_20850 [Paenibacillus sp. YSY-4.3]